MLRRAHRGTEFAARPKPFGASIFDNLTKRRIALHDTGRAGRGRQGHAGEELGGARALRRQASRLRALHPEGARPHREREGGLTDATDIPQPQAAREAGAGVRVPPTGRARPSHG